MEGSGVASSPICKPDEGVKCVMETQIPKRMSTKSGKVFCLLNGLADKKGEEMHGEMALKEHDLFGATTSSVRGSYPAINYGFVWATVTGKGTAKMEAATVVTPHIGGGTLSNFFAPLACADQGEPNLQQNCGYSLCQCF